VCFDDLSIAIGYIKVKVFFTRPNAPAWLRSTVSGIPMDEFDRLRVSHDKQEPKPQS
jgi:peptidyl-tRNA hydrolase